MVIPDNVLDNNEGLSFWTFHPRRNAFIKCLLQNGLPGSILPGTENRTDDLMAQAIGQADGFVDLINGRPAPPSFNSAGSAVNVVGWGAIDAKAGVLSERMIIRLLGDQDRCLRASVVAPVERPDVEAAFNQKSLRWAGFEGVIELEGSPKTTYIEILARSKGRYLRVGNRIQLNRE